MRRMGWVGIILVLLCLGCEHRRLVDPDNSHYLRVYINTNIKNVTYGFFDDDLVKPELKLPEVLRVAFCDCRSGEVVSERYLQNRGSDEKGNYLDGYVLVPPGDYNLMVYNFGTEATLIRDKDNYNNALAYTNPIAEHLYQYLTKSRSDFEGQNIVYEPDHLFVETCEPVHVPALSGMDTIVNFAGEYPVSRSVVESYYIQVKIRGVQWVSTAVSLLSGMAGSTVIHTRNMNDEDPAVLFFTMKAGHRTQVADLSSDPQEAVLYATFNTFGKLPLEESTYEVTFEFKTIDGRTQTETMRLNPVFDSPDGRKEKWLIIDKVIEIEKPPAGGGGFRPETEEWEEINQDIII